MLIALNAAAFAWYLHHRNYTRLWVGFLGGLFLGPLIWLYWPIVVWSERRGERRARQSR